MLTALGGSFEIIFFALIAVVVILLGWIVYLEMRLRRFMRGRSVGSLEDVMKELIDGFAAHDQQHQSARQHLTTIHERLANAPRGVATIRYNALAGNTSGRQSFATAIISERGDGVVISSIHSRDNTRVYAKPVAGFASEHELSEEEIAAINEARARCASC